jgi:hypothetical protein
MNNSKMPEMAPSKNDPFVMRAEYDGGWTTSGARVKGSTGVAGLDHEGRAVRGARAR